MTHIVLCNDDGIQAPGLRALLQAVSDLGTVSVVAPNQERSASAQSLTLRQEIYVEHVAEREWAVHGTPADAMILALHKLFPVRPDLVISGINPGGNLGENVFYSGTVGAAAEGAINHVPAIAVSVVHPGPAFIYTGPARFADGASDGNADRTSDGRDGTSEPVGRRDVNFAFAEAAKFTHTLARMVLKQGLPDGAFLNVNVPWEWTGKVRFTRQSEKITRTGLEEGTDRQGRTYYWIREERMAGELDPATDYAAISDGAISITPLEIDRTHAESLRRLAPWAAALESAVEGKP